MKKKGFVVLLLLLVGFIFFVEKFKNTSPISFTFHQAVFSVKPEGFVQTPLGGEPGTSFLKRPTFAELGIKKQPIIESTLTFYWQGIGFYLEARQIYSQGSARLKQPLLTYGESLPAGFLLPHELQLDTYHIGISYPMKIFKWKFSPQAELSLLNFLYAFNFDQKKKERYYRHITTSVGIASPHCYWMTSLFAVGGLEIKKYVSHTVHQWMIDYEDGQPLPNHIFFQGVETR